MSVPTKSGQLATMQLASYISYLCRVLDLRASNHTDKFVKNFQFSERITIHNLYSEIYLYSERLKILKFHVKWSTFILKSEHTGLAS